MTGNFSYNAEWTLATSVCRSFVRASSENGDSEGNETKKKEKKKERRRNRFHRCERRIEKGGGQKTEVGGIIRSFSKNVEKKKKKRTQGLHNKRQAYFFSPIFFFFTSLFSSRFQEKWGKTLLTPSRAHCR